MRNFFWIVCFQVKILILLLLASANHLLANFYSEFGIIRANITNYCSGSRWLVCCEPQKEPNTSEVIGFNGNGNMFRLQGNLRPGAVNLLSPDSYEKPSISFSTKEGFLYVWKMQKEENPFEIFLTVGVYEKMIKKFEIYPLWGLSKDGPISFELLKDDPDFYNSALALPRPQKRISS